MNGEKSNLPLSLSSEVVAALANAGLALTALASALSGKTVSTPISQPLTRPAPIVQAEAITIVEATNELLKAKARAGRCDAYLKNLRIDLRYFAQAMKNAALVEILPQEIERWLDASALSPRTKLNRLESVRLLFSFSVKRGYLSTNPALAVEGFSDTSRHQPVKIHTPEQVGKLLRYWQNEDLNICRMLALRYFAGLRACEVQRMTEEDIKLDRGIIEVRAAVAKQTRSRRRRIVTIQPNLKRWLALGGEIPLTDFNTKMARVGKAADVEWTDNVARHSFVSYHLAKFQNAGRTALEAGHTEQMTFGNYRELVTAEEAEKFWAIHPATCGASGEDSRTP